ncbi:hypothetical protein CDAR_409891 [Caerostris darwini]|uniref:Uncharacterized protein n=1 Tax=Caerostris darwini TaxID=1538125 RepID=A0AAV4VVQ4_9ARAC|nr:hypothetical protein CDAR_409891 [Caerostris darwini]
MDMKEIDLYDAQSFLSESQEINLIKPHSYALDAVAKYRKFISWWFFVRNAPRIMASDFRVLLHFMKTCQLPFETFSEDIASLGSIISTFIENFDILRKELFSLSEEVENFVKCALHFDPESSNEFFDMYNDILTFGCDILQCFLDCKKSFDDYISVRHKLATSLLL